jgi:hypothetical protein
MAPFSKSLASLLGLLSLCACATQPSGPPASPLREGASTLLPAPPRGAHPGECYAKVLIPGTPSAPDRYGWIRVTCEKDAPQPAAALYATSPYPVPFPSAPPCPATCASSIRDAYPPGLYGPGSYYGQPWATPYQGFVTWPGKRLY